MNSVFKYLKNNMYSLIGKDLAPIVGGEGAFRDVYRIVGDIEDSTSYKGCVVKYAKRDDAIRENRKEFQTWQAVKGTKAEKYFCPIKNKSPDNQFIIMEYAKLRSYSVADCMKLKREMRSDFNLTNIKISNKGLDIHRNNIAYYPPRNRIVLIDYPWGGDFKL